MTEHSLPPPPHEGTPHDQRECRSCNGHGLVLVDAAYDATTGELVQEVAACFICRGSGVLPPFSYATPRPRS